MSETKQLAAHYAVLQTDAVLDHTVMHYQSTVELYIEEFWERHPHCGRDARRLDAMGKLAHESLVALLRAMRATVIRSARIYLELRKQCGRNKDDLPELDDAVLGEVRRLRAAHDADLQERRAAATIEAQRQSTKAEDDAFDDALERHTEGLFDYGNGDGPGPWFTAKDEGGGL